MTNKKGMGLYIRICRLADSFFKKKVIKDSITKEGTEFEEKLKQDLKFSGLNLKISEIYAGAKFSSITAFSILLLIDLFIIFPFLYIPEEVDGLRYNSIDKNSDGINDIIQEIIPVEDIEYDEFGFEADRHLLGFQGKIDYSKVFFLVVAPSILVPFLIFIIFINHPRSYARKIRIKTLASLPQTVNYLAMSLRLTPSLDTAVSFAGRNLKGNASTRFNKILWDVYFGIHNKIEDAFLAFADEWGAWNESFKRSMYLLRASLLESTEEGRRAVLDKAGFIILTGVKLEISKFANSLKGPTMLMFAFGIILPIIIATMLPILGSGMDSLIWIILLMDIVLPLLCLLYARRIISRRPILTLTDAQTSFMNEAGKEERGKRKEAFSIFSNLKLVLTIISILVLFTIGIYVCFGGINSIEPRYGSLIMILSISIPTGFYGFHSSFRLWQQRERFLKIETELPDALYHLGTKIAEGKPLETALEQSATAMKGSEISKVFTTLLQRSRLLQIPVGSLLLDSEHNNIRLPTSVSASMKIVVGAVTKNSRDAGEIIIDISNYLRDLRIESEFLKQQLNDVLQMIKQTGIIFGPIIIGLTCGMYFMLNSSFPKMGISSDFGFGSLGSTDPIPGEIFILIFGIYLLFTLSAITYFINGIESPGDKILLNRQLSVGLITGASIFCIACTAGFIAFGV